MKDEPIKPQAHIGDVKNISLVHANSEMRAKHFESAMSLYIELLNKKPHLQKSIVNNITLLRNKRYLERNSRSHSRTLLCGQSIAHARLMVLANYYNELDDVSLCTWDIEKEVSITLSTQISNLPLKNKVFLDDYRAVDQVVEWVTENPVDTLHLVGLNGINFFLALFYKLIWSTKIIFDISSDEEEKKESIQDLSIGTFGNWESDEWRHNAFQLAQIFDNLSVSSPALQGLIGGRTIRDLPSIHNAPDCNSLRRKYLIRKNTKIILIANLDHKDIEQIFSLKPLLSLKSVDVNFAVLCDFPESYCDRNLDLCNESGRKILFFKQSETADALAIADAILVLDRPKYGDFFTYPSVFLDAISMHIQAFAYPASGYTEFFDCELATCVDPSNLIDTFNDFFAHPEKFKLAFDRALTTHLSKFSYEVSLCQLKRLQSESTVDYPELQILIRKLHALLPSEAILANAICTLPILRRSIEITQEAKNQLRLQNMLAGTILKHGYDIDFAETNAASLSQIDTESFLENVFECFFNRKPEVHEHQHFQPKLYHSTGRLEVFRYLLQCPEAQINRHGDKYRSADVGNLAISRGAISASGVLTEVELVFPIVDEPIVSIIIPVYGKIEYTLAALRSIHKNLPQTKFEIIVVDDHSPDSTKTVLQAVKTIKLIENKENLGFIKSCNRGAAHARGQFLCFLNNDTEVEHNWLDALIQTFNDFPNTGLVGSKLIYPDGRLQEAGGILWNDASAWNFGRFQDPELPEFNYAREVDFCSGASILISSNLFQQLGGFDEHYLPAYYEDVDLALKVKTHGFRVIFQPLSRVIHYEGITSGTDVAIGVKSSQLSNQKKLYERWCKLLKQYQENGKQVDRAKDRSSRYRALVIDHCTPTPNRDAGSVLTFNMLILLREMGFQVTFTPEDNYLYMPEYTPALQQRGIEVLHAPHVVDVHEHLKKQGARYDLVIVFRPGAAEKHFPVIRSYCPRAKLVFHTVDLHYLRMMRQAECDQNLSLLREAGSMKARELAAIKAADVTIVVSTIELEILKQEVSNVSIFVFPLVLQVRGTSVDFDKRQNIVFVGGFQHQPNVDAVENFICNVMPILRSKSPQLKLAIIGSNVPKHIQAMACEDILIKGFVEDLPSALDEFRIAIAPLRYGAGVKGKIASAMCAGIPSVATSIATEGMSIVPGFDVLTADTPQDFADAVLNLCTDKVLWGRIQSNALVSAEELWGGKAAWRHLQNILETQNFEIEEYKYKTTLPFYK